MARRRGRSPSLLGLLLIFSWIGGGFAGGVFATILSADAATKPNFLLSYGLYLCGALIGAGFAFLIARSLGPVDGVWRDLNQLPVRRSRVLGAVVGGGVGGVIGAIAVVATYQTWSTEILPMVVQAFLATGTIGALIGVVSGFQKG